MPFFDQYERFLTTSRTSPFLHRLNGRHAAIIERCRDQLDGRRVLDIASHDGRWTFAAVQAGAAHVTGIEPRAELVANARETFAAYDVPAARFEFVQGGVFEEMPGRSFDTVLCLGFYYHTVRHVELMDLIERSGAAFAVIDTEIVPASGRLRPEGDDPRLVHGNPYAVELFREPVDDQQMAVQDSATRNGHTLVGRPSADAIEFMADHFGFDCSRFDWKTEFESHPHLREWMVDYAEGWRETFYLARR